MPKKTYKKVVKSDEKKNPPIYDPKLKVNSTFLDLMKVVKDAKSRENKNTLNTAFGRPTYSIEMIEKEVFGLDIQGIRRIQEIVNHEANLYSKKMHNKIIDVIEQRLEVRRKYF